MRTTVIVSGALANKVLNGGEAWVRLSWVLGLRKLGCDVYFVEQIDANTCVDDDGHAATFEACANLAYFRQVVEEFGLSAASALIYENGERIHGLSHGELLELAAAADLLVNLTGHLTYEPMMRKLRRKAYVDLDPGFTQFWHASRSAGARLDGHDFYFTVGENVGTPACRIPSGGLRWRPTRPPVVLEQWPVARGGARERFTTVGTWRGPYGPVHYEGKTFGLKVHEFRKILALPRHALQTFEVALDIHPQEDSDRAALLAHGWRLIDARRVAADPGSFRDYVQRSGAEFSAAQGVYVETGSGWFSDRTVRYLASGKPALVQDTGFSRNYPVGEGLLAFSTLEQAVAGSERIAGDYEGHCQAARAVAEKYFDSDVVLSRFLDEVGIPA